MRSINKKSQDKLNERTNLMNEGKGKESIIYHKTRWQEKAPAIPNTRNKPKELQHVNHKVKLETTKNNSTKKQNRSIRQNAKWSGQILPTVYKAKNEPTKHSKQKKNLQFG